MHGRVVVFGNFVADVIAKPLERLPERGQLLILDTIQTHVGGNAPNTAGALGKLGESVSVGGRVGLDPYGDFLLAQLAGWGVETGPVLRDPEAATGVTLVAVDRTGERSFLHHFGANAAVTAADLNWDMVADASHFHLASFFVLPALDGAGAAALFKAARQRGCTTSLDVCWDREGRWLMSLGPALPHVDFFFPSEAEALALTGERQAHDAAAALRAGGCGAVLIKRGERGTYYLGPGTTGRPTARSGAPVVARETPAFPVAVRDSTGAGDCCIAGFLYGWRRGWDLERILRFANGCGARSVASFGGVTGIVSAPLMEEWLCEQGS